MDLRNYGSVTKSVFGHQAFRALSRNKLRSALAATGITIGIAAVVCVVAIGAAGSRRAQEQLQSLGDNLVWIEAGSRNVNGVRSGTHGMTSLTMGDAQAILSQVSSIKSVSPNVDGTVVVASGNLNWTTHFRGITPEFLSIRSWEVSEGDPFTAEDVAHAANVCLIGQALRRQIFGEDNAVGKYIRVNNQLFRVLGVLGLKGQTPTGFDQDDTIFMPYTTVLKKIRGGTLTWLDDIMCSARSVEDIEPAIVQIDAILRERHHIRPGGDDDFNIRHPEDLIKAQIQAKRTLAMFLISVASISLLVGGIGIMNVMLVSVTERTREIGLRLAVGATARAIQVQFLSEAVMLSAFGSLLGVLVGITGSFIMGYALKWPVSVPPEALIIAPLFAVGEGVFFGFYPAWRATRLDPIAALRHE
jgi:putative ABC transport system permease protein